MKMSNLLQEAAIDDQFNRQVDIIQTAVSKLQAIATRQISSSMEHPVPSQVAALRQVTLDLKSLTELLEAHI